MGALADTSTGGFFVTIATPKGGTTTKKIEGDQLTVGRGEDCNLTIQHETLSRRHMSVQLKNGQCWVEDHGSSNGTFVNGKRLKAHTPARVLPEDFIQLGQSGVRLSVSVEAQAWKSSTPPSLPVNTPDENTQLKEPPKDDTIVTSTTNERRAVRDAQDFKVLPRKSDEAGEQAEKLVQDAQKRASALIQEAELDAERRVEDIYRRAHATQAKMDEVYQKRLNEAYRSAEMVYQKSQSESETMLDQARAKSAEIRTQAEGFVMELRRRTEEDCERILDEAQVTARELKEGRLAEAEEMIRRKEEDIIRATREAMATRLARFEEDLLKEAGRQRELLEGELNDRRLQLEVDNKEQIENIQKLKTEASHLAEARDREILSFREKYESETKRLAELVDTETKRLHQAIATETAKLQAAEAEAAKQAIKLQALKDEVGVNGKKISDDLATLATLKTEIAAYHKTQDEAKKAADKVRITQEEVDGQLLAIRSKFEEAKGKLQRDELKHSEEMKLETTRKIAVLEQQLVEELFGKKERLSREIGLMIETHIKEHPESTPKSMRAMQEQLDRLMDTQIATLSKHPGAVEKQKSLVELKSREKWKATWIGIALGCIAAMGGQRAYRIVKAETSPIQRKVIAAQDERKADLEKRKFNPPQTKEIRETYADSVIYTEGFVQRYQNEEFQKKLLTAAAPYMLKTWRIDEEKTIQLLASTSALVTILKERREAIHPDYIPQGLEKMKEAENEANVKIRALLGSQVRFESYKKFERTFFEENAP